MIEKNIPFLCGGTFLCQLLRARPSITTAEDHTKCKKEELSEQNMFNELVSIFQLSTFYGGASLKTYTSNYKKCKSSCSSFCGFSDSDLRYRFDEDIKKTNSTALIKTVEFVKKYIIPDKYEQLVCCLIGLILEDISIDDNEEFYIIDTNVSVKKKELLNLDTIFIEQFILGVWHYIIMNRYDDNEKGEETYNAWYPRRYDYRGTVGSSVSRHIDVKNVQITNTADTPPVGDTESSVDNQNGSNESEPVFDNFTHQQGNVVNQTLYSAKFMNFGNGVIQADTIHNIIINPKK